jgi:hypothetical protein
MKCPRCGEEIPAGEVKYNPMPGFPVEKVLAPCRKCIEELKSKMIKKDRRMKNQP